MIKCMYGTLMEWTDSRAFFLEKFVSVVDTGALYESGMFFLKELVSDVSFSINAFVLTLIIFNIGATAELRVNVPGYDRIQ